MSLWAPTASRISTDFEKSSYKYKSGPTSVGYGIVEANVVSNASAIPYLNTTQMFNEYLVQRIEEFQWRLVILRKCFICKIFDRLL